MLHPKYKKNLREFEQTIHQGPASWAQAFGDSPDTDEIFMAYHYALFVEQVAKAGKEVYPLPLFTNVWQNYADEDNDNPFPTIAGGGGKPGDYPSGGGTINVLDIWQDFAPSLDFIAPDVYLNEYATSCALYRHRNQALFIPEQRRDDFGARRVWNALGSHQALGTSPFGIDTVDPVSNPFKKHYGLLAKTSMHILAAQRRPALASFFDGTPEKGKDPTPSISKTFGNWKLLIERSFVFGKESPGFGIVIHLGNAKFMLIGEGF